MAERRKRRRFTAEFEAEAVERLLEGGKGPSEAATELGISPGQPSGWRDEHPARGPAGGAAPRAGGGGGGGGGARGAPLPRPGGAPPAPPRVRAEPRREGRRHSRRRV